MLPTLVIFFRESLEASLIVGIILAYLRRVGRDDRAAAVWAGVGASLTVDVAVALISYHVLHHYDGSRTQTVLEGSTYLVATGILAYMSFWMKGQSGALRRDLEASVQAALGRGSLVAMVLLSAITVGREGLETVFFTLAIALHARPWGLVAGGALGLALGLSCSWWVYRLGRRLPLGAFFNTLGVVLLLFAAGLLADGVQNFQALGWLPWLGHIVWHSGRLLSEDSALGDILHSFFGYADAPTVLQLGAYLMFVTISLTTYLGLRPGGSRPVPVPRAR